MNLMLVLVMDCNVGELRALRPYSFHPSTRFSPPYQRTITILHFITRLNLAFSSHNSLVLQAVTQAGSLLLRLSIATASRQINLTTPHPHPNLPCHYTQSCSLPLPSCLTSEAQTG